MEKNSRNGVFCIKVLKECKNLSEILETEVTNVDDYACPKFRIQTFRIRLTKTKKYKWKGSNYPFCHP